MALPKPAKGADDAPDGAEPASGEVSVPPPSTAVAGIDPTEGVLGGPFGTPEPGSTRTVEAPKAVVAEEPAPEEDALLGATLVGTYLIESVIGEGGMGRVYAAAHTRIPGKKFAIKVLHPEFARRADVLERFQREAEAASAIRSVHVVDVIDIDATAEGAPFMVCELMNGVELGDHILERGKLDIGYAAGVVRQVCRALSAAHEVGVVHRDIKPENVFLTGTLEQPTAKVLDFGISRLQGKSGNTLTQSGMVLGTPAYMAPEQARGDRVDERADVYAAGAILYCAITGRPPFVKDDPWATLTAVITQDAPPPRSLEPSIPAELELIIQRAIARELPERYSTAAELAAALAPYDTLDREGASGAAPAAAVERSDGKVQDAAGELVALAVVTSLVVIMMAAGIIGGVIRLVRGGTLATLSTTEAVLVSAVVVAILTTPVVLLVKKLRGDVLGNTARSVDALAALRPALGAGLAVYGFMAIALRWIENSFMPRGSGLAWPGWDLLVPLTALAAAGLMALRGGKSGSPGLQKIPSAAWVGAGVGAVGLLLAGALVVRQPIALVGADVDAAEDEDGAVSPSSSASATTGTAAPAKRSSARGVTQLSPDSVAYGLWEELNTLMRRGQIGPAVDKLAQLVEVEPGAAEDPKVRREVVRLGQIALGHKITRKRMTKLLTTSMGTSGIDVLYELVTTRGGSVGAKRAGELLGSPDVLSRGTPALQVAYKLRQAKGCDAKKALFAEARASGDYRTVTQLRILKACNRRGVCCLKKDPDLDATLKAILARE